jgi:hypothetical protein
MRAAATLGWLALLIALAAPESGRAYTLGSTFWTPGGLDEDMPQPEFLDPITAAHGGNRVATRAAEIGRDDLRAEAAR